MRGTDSWAPQICYLDWALEPFPDPRPGRRSDSDDEDHIVVDGVRKPDDESDRVDHRNGRFVNNTFIPKNKSGQGKKIKNHIVGLP